MEFGVSFFRAAPGAWFERWPWAATWVQQDTPTRRVRYVRLLWLVFGLTAWRAAESEGESL